MDPFLAIYSEVTAEFCNDLKRRLEITLHSVSDPFATAALTNDFVVSELAQLRAQMLDLDLRISQIVCDSRKSALLSAATSIAMPKIYGSSETIRMGDPIATYGFYMLEDTKKGHFRWSGPITNCGLIAHIDRASSISATVPILSLVTPEVTVVDVHVDGEPVAFTLDHPHTLRFQLPALTQGDDLLFTPTLFSFTVNKVVRVSDLNPNSADHRAIGIAIQEINLAPTYSAES
jgi:hypothetical protein